MKAVGAVDSAFLWLETRKQPMHVAGLNIFTPPVGAPPTFVGDLVAAWRQHPLARSPFNLRPVLRLGIWYWEQDEDFELDYHLRHLALPYPGRIRELLAMVSRLHGNLLDRNRPLWEAYLIEGLPDGRFAFYTKIHHALIDGVTGARVTAQVLSADPAEAKAPLWDIDLPALQRRAGGRGAAPAGLVRQLAAAASAGRDILPGIGSGLWDIVRAQLGPTVAQTAAGLPFQAPPTPFNVEIHGSRRFAAQSYSLDRLRRIGAACGATVNDVTLAICAGALRRYLQQIDRLPRLPLVAMVPVSLHDATTEGGNQVTLLMANLATDQADPLERLRCIMQSTAAGKAQLLGKPRLQKMAHGLTTLAPMGPAMLTGASLKHPLFNLVISNVPGAKETLYLGGARLDEVYPVSIPTHYMALNITISGYADKLGFGFTACRRSVPALQRMLGHTDEAIAELELAVTALPAAGARTRRIAPASEAKPTKPTKAAKAAKSAKASGTVAAAPGAAAKRSRSAAAAKKSARRSGATRS